MDILNLGYTMKQLFCNIIDDENEWRGEGAGGEKWHGHVKSIFASARFVICRLLLICVKCSYILTEYVANLYWQIKKHGYYSMYSGNTQWCYMDDKSTVCIINGYGVSCHIYAALGLTEIMWYKGEWILIQTTK